MSGEYRDMSIPYTEKELEELEVLFKALPTFRDGAVETSDMAAICKMMRYERTPEQVLAYKDYWDRAFGKVYLDHFMANMKVIHSMSLFCRELALRFDTNKNGLIDKEEFEPLLKLISAQDPAVASISYEEFVKEADTNLDGKVSIEECARWVEKHSPTRTV